MRKIQRPLVAVVVEGPDHQTELSKKKLSDQEIKDNLPEYWKELAQAAKHQIAVPIPGTDLHT